MVWEVEGGNTRYRKGERRVFFLIYLFQVRVAMIALAAKHHHFSYATLQERIVISRHTPPVQIYHNTDEADVVWPTIYTMLDPWWRNYMLRYLLRLRMTSPHFQFIYMQHTHTSN